MKRSVALAVVFVLSATLSAQAAVTLQTGDIVTFNGQATGLSEGYGGAFNWDIYSVVPSPASSPVGTTFQTFCVELQQNISNGTNYTIGQMFTPATGGTANSSGNKFNNLSGVYIFDLWSNNLITQNAADAGAVQVALWESEGYTSAQITGTGGYTTAQLNAANTLIPTLLATADVSGSYSSSWAPTDLNAFFLTHNGYGAQDQIVLVSTSTHGGSPAVPEPVGAVIWGVGTALAAGGAALRRARTVRAIVGRGLRRIVKLYCELSKAGGSPIWEKLMTGSAYL